MIDVSFIRILYNTTTFSASFAFVILLLTTFFPLIVASMPKKSTIGEDVASLFPLIFLLAAFCLIGQGIRDGVSFFETLIDVFGLDDNE